MLRRSPSTALSPLRPQTEANSNIWHLVSTDGWDLNWTKPVDVFTKAGSFDRNRIIEFLDEGLIYPIYYAGHLVTLSLLIHMYAYIVVIIYIVRITSHSIQAVYIYTLLKYKKY